MKRVKNRADVESGEGETNWAGIWFNIAREEKKGKEKRTARGEGVWASEQQIERGWSVGEVRVLETGGTVGHGM